MRAAIARRMTHSKQTAPHFYVSSELPMDAVLARAREMNADREAEERVTLTAFLLRAVALTLKEHPALNAVWADDVLEQVEAVHLGVAIALEDGLIAPAILNADALEVRAMSHALRDLAARARARRLKAAESSAATFTLSNLGMFEVSQFTAIINPPQVAILATGKVQQRAQVVDGEVVARSLVTGTVSADHRAVDGALVARFLTDLGGRLADPAAWTQEAA